MFIIDINSLFKLLKGLINLKQLVIKYNIQVKYK